MTTSNLISVVRQYLATQHMFVDDDWITGCVEYIREDSGNNSSETEIKNLAREQWLLNDLKDICPGCLPPDLKNQSKTVLNGRFVLQINAAMDIGTPAYQQYLKLQKVNMENVEATTNFEEKISSHRMIKLWLTDGVQEITGLEYRPMRNLSCDITPGCKVLIKGPVECRRGSILLTEGVIELLGGEVAEITQSNAMPQLLATKLDLPLTQDLNTTQSHSGNTTVPSPHTQMPPPATHESMDHRPVARVTSLQAAFNDEDIDIDQLENIEAQITDIPTKRALHDTNTNPEKKIKIDLKNTNVDLITTKIDLTTSEFPVARTLPAQIDLTQNVNTVEDYPDDNDVFFEEDEDLDLREMEAKFDQQPCFSKNRVSIAFPSEPYVYIKQINDMTENEKAGKVFKVKGQIMKLLSKLSIGKEGWSLRCTIVDGTGSIDVEFTSTVLSKLVGFTPQEMNQLKKQMATNPELKEKAVCALQKAKDTLQVLYCIIELTMLEVPKITCLIPFDETHADSQRRRLEGSGL